MTSWVQTIESAWRRRNGLMGSRLFGGVGANAYGQAINILIQLGTIPLLLSLWGAQTFGLWLVISAIPSYLALADFGFSSAANNVMTLSTARGEHAEASRVFHSLLVLNGLVSVVIVVLASAVVLLLPDNLLPHTALIGAAEVRIVWILQTLLVALTLTCGALMGGFQSSGRYALGFFLLSSARLLETLALVAGAFLFTGFAAAAGLMLAARGASLVIFAVTMLRGAPWLSLGYRDASVADVRRLVNPALAVVAFRAASAVSLQGFILVVGSTLSLSAVATFSSVRTLTRAVIQLGGVINMAIMPELTRAFGGSDFGRVRRLIRLNFISVMALNILAFVAIAALGKWFIMVWTHGQITPNTTLIIGFGVVACLNSFWMSQATLIMAINRHETYAYRLLVVSVVSVLAAVPITKTLGVDGLSLPLLAGEIAMIVIVGHAFKETLGHFAEARR